MVTHKQGIRWHSAEYPQQQSSNKPNFEGASYNILSTVFSCAFLPVLSFFSILEDVVQGNNHKCGF